MATEAVLVGHAIVGDAGIVLRVDGGFCAIMKAAGSDLVGCNLLALTAPEDRLVCADHMKTLRATGRPFRVAKRMLRPDGSTVWVDKTVAIPDFGDDSGSLSGLIVATLIPIEDPDRLEDPARLLSMVLYMRDSRRAQSLLFEPGLATDSAWDILLAGYIAEAQGRSLTAAAVVAETGTAEPVVRRWLRALIAHGLLEAEGDTHYRLTGSAYARFETYLANRILKTPQTSRHR